MEYGWSVRFAGVAPAGLIAACLAVPAGEDPGGRATGEAPAAQSVAQGSIDWSQGDCVARLRTLQQATSEGRLGPDERPPFAVQLVAAPGGWLDAVPPLPIEADLPMAIDDAGLAGPARCVLRIGPPRDQRAAQRAVNVQDVRSVYQSSVRSERNPDYDAAQLALRAAKEDAKGGPRVVKVGDPLLDLIGTAVGSLIGGVDDRVHQQGVDEAAAELATTPRSRDRPVYRPYGFERVVVRAEKQAVVPVALLDAGGRELRATELRQSERRELFVLRGLDPRDRDYEQHRAASMTEAELARWARTPPVLRLSSAAIALTEGAPVADAHVAEIAPTAGPALPEPTGIGPLLQLRPDDVTPAPLADPWIEETGTDQSMPAVPGGEAAPHAASVVAIRAGRSTGHGFYVREDLVLTTSQLVGGTSVVDVTTADGATVPALVAAVDAARGLALLQVPRPGPPAALYGGNALAPVRSAGATKPGLPVLLENKVVGMTTLAAGADGQDMVSVAAIDAFLASQASLLAALP